MNMVRKAFIGVVGASVALAGVSVPNVAVAQPRRGGGGGSSAAAAGGGSGGRDEARGPSKAATIDLPLVVGENKTISAADVTSYSVGAPGVIDIKVTPDQSQFVIVALRPGTTTVLMLKRNGTEVTYSVNVFARAPAIVEQELAQLLEGYTGLRVRRVGTRFFIEGGVSTEADMRRTQVIASLYPGQVESLVVVGSVGMEHTINVRIDFYFVQYDKSSNWGVGVAWPARFGGGRLGATYDLIGGSGAASLTADQALPALDLAQTRGWAKVLKHSTVVTTSGSEAAFDSGGEQNFAVAAGLTGTIQAIPFGTNVAVLPRYDVENRTLEVKVQATVSDLTAPAGTSSLPGRKTSKISTFVHLRLGQSLVLSGIRSSSETHSVAGLPLLSQIPVLGVLFGGHTNSETEVEGAIFIIPSIVESTPRKAHDIVETAMKQYETYSGRIDKVSSYPKTPPDYK
jgi:pilus assembly protein CpaC